MPLADLKSAYSFYDKPKRFELPGATRAEALPEAMIRLGRTLLSARGALFLAKQQILLIDANSLKTNIRAQRGAEDRSLDIRGLTSQQYGTVIQPDGTKLVSSVIDIFRPGKTIQAYARNNVATGETPKYNRLIENIPLRDRTPDNPERYFENNISNADSRERSLRTKLRSSSDERIFKSTTDTPIGYGSTQELQERYRTLTSYSAIAARAKTRTDNRATNIDFLTGTQFDQSLKTQFEYINRTGRGLVELTIGSRSFRSYITGLSDNLEATWNGEQDQGRADQRYMYAGWSRNISLSFMVAIETSKDLKEFWDSMTYVGQLALPTYTSKGYHGRITTLTIGGLYSKTPVICTSIGYTWDTETPWALKIGDAEGNDRPMYTEVQTEFIYIGDGLQTRNSNLFG
jgi:hypothetical protein